jgi:ABC-type arginine transport system ATPase subunit
LGAKTERGRSEKSIREFRCSTVHLHHALIAAELIPPNTNLRAFQSIRYPILPQIEIAEDNLAKLQSEYGRAEILHARNHTLSTPHDFDISPHLSVIKPMIEAGFDYRSLTWAEESMLDRIGHVMKRYRRILVTGVWVRRLWLEAGLTLFHL